MALANLAGCSAPFQSQVDSRPLPTPTVRVDAAWFTENGSHELAQRLKEERRQQVESTLARRAEGQVGLSLLQPHSDKHQNKTGNQPPVVTASHQQNGIAEAEAQSEAGSRGKAIIRLADNPAAH